MMMDTSKHFNLKSYHGYNFKHEKLFVLFWHVLLSTMFCLPVDFFLVERVAIDQVMIILDY